MRGQPSAIGCCAEIIQYQRLSDDRMKILTLGQQRFRVLEYIRENPTKLVWWSGLKISRQKDLRALATEVEQLLRRCGASVSKVNRPNYRTTRRYP